ncbi:MAG TPA: flagellar basal-body MS-ring/collar protein FliF [Acetobacteraceae bacterium]|nr:flagellar basal-body MS-ring/collar protein FliF [Acetobacteraceae bacterium]
MQALIQGLRALGAVRLAALGAVGAAVLGMLALLVLTSGRQNMALVYGGLDLSDAGQAADLLSRQHIPYQLAQGGTALMVPADLVPEARVALARAGLPQGGGGVGYELFDRGTSGLTSTEFEQQIAETRALEGELARSIRAIAGVRAARVHLVLPRRAPFAREAQPASASVLLTMQGAARLDREGVQAILNLVAAAVPGLKPRDIAIVDSRGELLARAGAPVDAEGAAMSADEVRRATEMRLARAVEEMLEQSLGPGHVRAEAAVQMDYQKVQETQERFDPDGQVARSEQSVNTTSKSTEAPQTVTVQNNLPNAEPAASGAGTEESRQQQTTNYEISKTVRTLVNEQPRIARISLAVLVDSAKAKDSAELGRIADLVKTAIGFDAKRGDEVRVEAMPFAALDAPEPEKPGLLGVRFEKSDLMHLAEVALVGLLGIVGLLSVLRPMVMRLTSLGTDAPVPLLAGAGAGGGRTSLVSPAERAGLAGPAPPAGLLEDESMVNIAQVEGQMRASSIRRLAELVDRHPDETLMIVRGWIGQEPA